MCIYSPIGIISNLWEKKSVVKITRIKIEYGAWVIGDILVLGYIVKKSSGCLVDKKPIAQKHQAQN